MNFMNLFRKKQSGSPNTHLEKLASSKIWLLAVGIDGTPPLPAECNEDALKIVSEHRKPISELTDDDSIFPFNMIRAGAHILPVFSELDALHAFCQNKSIPHLESVFEPISMSGQFVGEFANDIFVIVVDPYTDQEITLSKEQVKFIKRMPRQ